MGIRILGEVTYDKVRLLHGNKDGYIPFATMSWGAQLYKGHVFYSDWNSGLGAAKVMPIKPDNSKVNQYLN